MLHGTFTGKAMPWYKQLLARKLGLPPLLRRGDFGKVPLKGPDFIKPTASPPSLSVLADRLETAERSLEQSLADAPSGQPVKVDHPIFGRLPLQDLLHFLFIHTNHHRPQISAGALL
jgi:uncharacterized damage-inducible protein DinB